MRYLKLVLTVLAFTSCMVFFVQNTQPLSQSVVLELNLVSKTYVTIPIPVYALALGSFLAGVLVAMAFLLVDRIRLGLELKALKKSHAALEDEALALRTLPLNQPGNMAPGSFGPPSSSAE